MASAMPGWLEGLVEENFFADCVVHESRKKNEKNMYCLGCCTSICPHCAPAHSSHPLLQVRRYIYNDVVRLDDLEKLIECSYIQPYTINSAKVVFLKPRPQARPFKGSGNICLTCDRILQEPFHFCCLSCKVEHVLLQGQDLSSILFGFDQTAYTFSHFENLRMDGSYLQDNNSICAANSLLFDDSVNYKNYAATSNDNDDLGMLNGASEVPKKKKKKNGVCFPEIVVSFHNRRKSAPHRSPLA